MLKTRWLLALPLAFAAWVGTAQAASIRDEAGIFDPDTVRQAQVVLDRVESRTHLPTTIETIDSLQGDSIDAAAIRLGEKRGASGLIVLIAKQEKKIDVRVDRSYLRAFPTSRLSRIRSAFTNEFRNGDFGAGLTQGVREIEREAIQAAAENGGMLRQHAPAVGRRVPMGRPGAAHQSFGLGSLLGIGLGIIAILFILRLIGGALGGGYGGQGRMMGGPGRMMGGPGYGGPGYGGGGGGFWSSMFGGIGGALAGNWLYDQFSGRHHGGGYSDTSSSYGDAGQGYSGDTGAGDWAGGGGVSGDWGDSGGGDWGGGGGGDWGGGDSGGGGDW